MIKQKNPKEVRTILLKALETYGLDLQAMVAIEEMSELTKELCKRRRGAKNLDAIVEEIADVKIMLSQLTEVYGSEAVQMAFDTKLARLEARLERDTLKSEEG